MTDALDPLLDLMKKQQQIQFMLDIKYTEQAVVMADIINQLFEKNHLCSHVFVISFYPTIIYHISKKIITSLVVAGSVCKPHLLNKLYHVIKIYVLIKLCQLDMRTLPKNIFSPSMLANINKKVILYTVNNDNLKKWLQIWPQVTYVTEHWTL